MSQQDSSFYFLSLPREYELSTSAAFHSTKSKLDTEALSHQSIVDRDFRIILQLFLLGTITGFVFSSRISCLITKDMISKKKLRDRVSHKPLLIDVAPHIWNLFSLLISFTRTNFNNHYKHL